jgi:hypothetical protein
MEISAIYIFHLLSVPTIPYIQEAIPGKTFINVTWKINKNDTAGFNYFVEYRKYGKVFSIKMRFVLDQHASIVVAH